MWAEFMDILALHAAEAPTTPECGRHSHYAIRYHFPITGDTRVIRRFALLPITANGELRMLGWCKIHQTYGRTSSHKWCNDYFID